MSRAARGPAARGRKTDEKGMRRPRGDQAPRGVRSGRARLARARARDRDARRRSDDLETGAGGVAQRAPPGPAPERARLFVLPGDAWRNALRLPFFAPPPTARHPRISAKFAKFSIRLVTHFLTDMRRSLLLPQKTHAAGQTHPARVARRERGVAAPPLALGEPARVRRQDARVALRRVRPRVSPGHLAPARPPGRPRPPPDPQRERALSSLVPSRARRL